jgi:hygromycin-B 4-O-kinase
MGIDKKTVEKFANNKLGQNIEGCESIDTGEHAHSFFIYTNEKDYVIKFNDEKESFEKDRYAYNNFHSNNIPIAETIETGKGPNSFYYAILEKCSGEHPGFKNEPKTTETVHQLIKTLGRIHEINIQETNGYGEWTPYDGNAEHDSWKKYLLSFADFVRSDEFLFDIEKKPSIQDVLNSYKQLIKYCPEGRRLVHADCGFDNVLFKDNEITCVIDWGNSVYGDFVLDIAWLKYWHDDYNYENLYRSSTNKKRNYNNFAKRIDCYKLKIALGTLHFFGQDNKEKSYRKFKEKKDVLLKA